MFTGTAIMQLVERGKPRLDDRAATHLSWLASNVTLRQLLDHAGGPIRDGLEADSWRVEQRFSDVATLRALPPDASILPPNMTFKYSNVGYALLGQHRPRARGRGARPLCDRVYGPISRRAASTGQAERYGLGVIAERIGKARPSATAAASRAKSTRTRFDPVDRLVVLVLSNANGDDGQAAPLAAQIVRIVDFAQRYPGGSNADLTRYTGRFASVAGAAFGGKLFGLGAASENPTKSVSELEVVEADQLRIASSNGFSPALRDRDALASTRQLSGPRRGSGEL